MTQIGKVTTVLDGRAAVEVQRASACGENCAQCRGGCQPTKHRAIVRNTAGASEGDTVRIETPDGALLRGALLLYIGPLALFFVCYGLVQVLWANPPVSAASGAAGLLIGAFIMRALDRKIAPEPEITRILRGGEEER